LETLITVVHVVVSIFLVIVVLLQAGKGAEIGATMGGAGSQTLFGGGGSGNLLSKLTVAAAVTFMVTSTSLSIVSSNANSGSVMDTVAPQAPTEGEAPVDPAGTTPLTAPADAEPGAMDAMDTEQGEGTATNTTPLGLDNEGAQP